MNFNPFGSVPVPKKGRTNFNESHSLSGTFPLSKMIPVVHIDSIPGSAWNIDVYNLTKLETLIAPAMQQVDASILWFKVPKRLVFKNFKKWYSGGEDGKDDHQKPHIHLQNILNVIMNDFPADDRDFFINLLFGPGSLWDYIGLPCPIEYNVSTGIWQIIPSASINSESASSDPDDRGGVDPDSDFVDMIPFMAYHYIYDCYFRDQTLSESFFVDAEEGNFEINKFMVIDAVEDVYYFGPESKEEPGVDVAYYTSDFDISEGGELEFADFVLLSQLFRRAWRKEYFTSALPTPQRGPEVSLNLFEDAQIPVEYDGSPLKVGMVSNPAAGSSYTGALEGASPLGPALNETDLRFENTTPSTDDNKVKVVSSGASVDLSGLSPITIVALRNLFKLQAFLEKNNVSGGRYIETILAHWGERIPDFTVQRAQFVRATTLPVQISEVTATANTSGVNSLVGDQAGRGRVQGNLGYVHMYTQEPSVIFGLYCVTAPPKYANQGIPRQFQHTTRFDEPWTDFQHIGEQAIKTRELYYPFKAAKMGYALNEDFGYQQRYSEYKFMPDRVVGDFKTSLSYWHMARMFNGIPRLNESFITQNLDPRIFAVQGERPVTADFYFKIKAKLKLSKYSTPKLS